MKNPRIGREESEPQLWSIRERPSWWCLRASQTPRNRKERLNELTLAWALPCISRREEKSGERRNIISDFFFKFIIKFFWQIIEL